MKTYFERMADIYDFTFNNTSSWAKVADDWRWPTIPAFTLYDVLSQYYSAKFTYSENKFLLIVLWFGLLEMFILAYATTAY